MPHRGIRPNSACSNQPSPNLKLAEAACAAATKTPNFARNLVWFCSHFKQAAFAVAPASKTTQLSSSDTGRHSLGAVDTEKKNAPGEPSISIRATSLFAYISSSQEIVGDGGFRVTQAQGKAGKVPALTQSRCGPRFKE